MKKKLTVAGLIATIIVCAAVVYRNLNPARDDGYVPARERALIKQFDKDGDGKLSAEEKRAAKQAAAQRAAEWLKQFDKDGDGKLNAEEKQAAEKAQADRRREAGRRSDKDGDGKRSEAAPRAATEAPAR